MIGVGSAQKTAGWTEKKGGKKSFTGVTFDQKQARWSGSYTNMKQQGLQDVAAFGFYSLRSASASRDVAVASTFGTQKSTFMASVSR